MSPAPSPRPSGGRREPVFADDWEEPIPDPHPRRIAPALPVPALPAGSPDISAPRPVRAPAAPAATTARAAASARRYVATPPATVAALRLLGSLAQARMREWFADARPIGAGEAVRLLLIHHAHGTPGGDGLTQRRLAALRAALPTWDAWLRGLSP